MNALRYLVAVCLVFLTALIGIPAAAGSETEKKENTILKTTNVAEAFYEEGIALKPTSELSAADFVINEKQPLIYEFPESGEELFIYEYTSIEKMHNAFDVIKAGALNNNEGFVQLQKNDGYLISPLQAKNILLLYVVKYDPKTASAITDMESLYQFTRSIAPHMEMLKDITFSKLNEGRTLKYQGRSESWEGKVVLDYYQYIWSDKDGKSYNESWYNEEFYLKYLGTDSNRLNEIMCTYEGPAGGGQGIFQYPTQSFDSDGYLRLGSSGGDDSLNLDLKYTMTIQWGDGADIFKLEPLK